MSSQVPNSANPVSGDSQDCQGEGVPESRRGSKDQVSRLAALVASGDLSVPTDLSGDQLRRLVRQVREYRRRRLVKHIAHAIADDIVRSREQL